MSTLELKLFGRTWRWHGWTATGMFMLMIYAVWALAFGVGVIVGMSI